MGNIMNMVNIKNHVTREGFDLSKKVNFTAKAGELLPVWSTHVLPGDVYDGKIKSFTRTKPVNTAAFARTREYYDFYFVPYELLWNRAPDVLTQMVYQQQHADSLISDGSPLTDEVPYITCEQIAHYIYTISQYKNDDNDKNFAGFSRAKQSVKLLEYLNLGNYEQFVDKDWEEGVNQVNTNFDLNVFKLLAYQKIYADWFRDQQWEKVDPSTFNMDYVTGKSTMNVPIPTDTSGQNAGFFDNYNFFDLRYCNWMKDMFHGVLPQPQYGETSVVPLTTSSSPSDFVPVLPTSNVQSSSSFYAKFNDGPDVNKVSFTDNSGDPWRLHNVITTTDGEPSFGVAYGYKSIPSSSLSGLSILALRQYEFLQKWKEIAQSGRQDYKDMIQKIWNVPVNDAYSHLSQYVGGFTGDLSINEVVNSNITGDFGADIAGKGICMSDGSFHFEAKERYGVLMCIYHCVPVVDYTTDYVDPLDTKVNAADFANPVFDKVGMQPVYRANMDNKWLGGDVLPGQPLGYAPRYIEYKTAIDQSIGEFKRSLKNWVVSYNADDIIGLGYTPGAGDANHDGLPQPAQSTPPVDKVSYAFFKIIPQILDPIFAEEATEDMSTDQFWVSSFFDIKAVKNLDANGLPY